MQSVHLADENLRVQVPKHEVYTPSITTIHDRNHCYSKYLGCIVVVIVSRIAIAIVTLVIVIRLLLGFLAYAYLHRCDDYVWTLEGKDEEDIHLLVWGLAASPDTTACWSALGTKQGQGNTSASMQATGSL